VLFARINWLKFNVLSQISAAVEANPKIRLYFLDALRAFAILMMLQGHFVDTLLANEFRDLSNPVFSTWFFMRGLTAPVFFTVTGIVFVFLMLKEQKPLREHVRVRKGIRRGLMLLALGYLLKWNIFSLITLNFHSYHFTVDVLHIIGLGLLLLIGVYAAHRTWGISFPIAAGILGMLIFLIFPVMKTMDWTNAPRLLANYFSMQYGSTFNIFPWLGYTMLGGVIGSLAHYRTAWFKKWWMPLAFFATGLWLHLSSYTIFNNLSEVLASELSQKWLENQYIFWRFGHVLIVLSVFIFLEQVLRKGFHSLFLKIGSETLTIYSGHYVVLYGTWFGIGFSQLWYRQLNPMEVVVGAFLFEAAFILLIAHIDVVRYRLHTDFALPMIQHFRRFRVLVLRNFHHATIRHQSEYPTLSGWITHYAFRAIWFVFQQIPQRAIRK
jgi:uncharacterized membrane protein